MSTLHERHLAPGCQTQAAEQQRTVAQAAEAALTDTGYFPLRQIACEFDGSMLTLRGHVPSFHMKQAAQAAVSHVSTIREIDNQLEVT